MEALTTRRAGRETVVGCAVATGTALVAIVMSWRGADWPAQVYRVHLFHTVGFTQWDNQWYGGHHSPGYSVLFPMLGDLLSPIGAGLLSVVVATAAFAAIVARRLASPRVAVVWFATASVTNLIVGRLTFALGLAVGLCAVAALAARRPKLAVALAVLTPLASPVAGVFLALAAVAWALTTKPVGRIGLVVALAAIAPVVALSVTFPEGGRFPFLFGDFVLTVTACAAAFVVVPRHLPALRIGAVLYGIAATGAFLVPNPLGGNVTRLGAYVAGPIIAGVLWPTRRALLALLAVPLVIWVWQPAVDGMTRSGVDPSTRRAYYQPLLTYLATQPVTRLEIPFTRRHWETVYVAERIPLARGWERQLDFAYNPLFYERLPLEAGVYSQWLADNAIGLVALPDAELDGSAKEEAALLRAGVAGLEPAWTGAHWRVWNVSGARPLVEGPARLTTITPDSFTLTVDGPADVLVRIRYSTHWDIEGRGCVVESPDGWTLLRAPAGRDVRVRQVVSRWVPFKPDRTDVCPAPRR